MILHLKFELLSDSIFASGESLPGGADIHVKIDGAGHPYISATTFKGLFREALENYLVWTHAGLETADRLLGQPGPASEQPGHLRFSDLSSSAGKGCLGVRSFTSIENSVAKDGTFRCATVIRKGTVFTGTLTCDASDRPLVTNVLKGIQYAGTMRSRGFGHVLVTVSDVSNGDAGCSGSGEYAGDWLHYSLRLKSPLIATNLPEGYSNGNETRLYLPGSMMRGLALNRLAEQDSDFFRKYRRELLQVHFLDAAPQREKDEACIPSPMGFYEDKGGDHFEQILICRDITPGNKRANLGNYCTIREGILRCWKSETGEQLRNRRNGDHDIFYSRALSAGQLLDGYIYAPDETIQKKLMAVLNSEELWIGAGQYSGFGHAACEGISSCAAPAWWSFGYREGDCVPEKVYMLLLSPMAIRDDIGEVKAPDETYFSGLLGVPTEIAGAAASLVEMGGVNRTRRCREPAMMMYSAGSVLELRFPEGRPTVGRLEEIQRDGIGVRREFGCGRILFLRDFEQIRGKELLKPRSDGAAEWTDEEDRLAWLMDTPVPAGMSNSQKGALQVVLESADNIEEEAEAFFRHNMSDRGAEYAAKFADMHRFVMSVLYGDAEAKLPAGIETDIRKRRDLLCAALDYSRKGGDSW